MISGLKYCFLLYDGGEKFYFSLSISCKYFLAFTTVFICFQVGCVTQRPALNMLFFFAPTLLISPNSSAVWLCTSRGSEQGTPRVSCSKTSEDNNQSQPCNELSEPKEPIINIPSGQRNRRCTQWVHTRPSVVLHFRERFGAVLHFCCGSERKTVTMAVTR